jgi:hypothetical protein
VRAQERRGAPSLHLIRADTQPLPHFLECQHPSFPQSFPARLQSMILCDAGDHWTMEWSAITGRKAPRVQIVSDGLTGMVIE